MQWLKNTLDVRYIIEGGGPRKEVWEIPEAVLKEILINSQSHRDFYDKGARTVVELFTDRVEISNPGGLVSAIPKQDFGKRSHSRNPLIFGLFERMDMVEQVGSGISRIINLMKEAELPPPDFSIDGMFTVTLQRPQRKSDDRFGEKEGEKEGENISENQQKIVEAMKANRKITIVELSALIGINEANVEKNIKKLRELNIVKRIGPAKGGHWEVNVYRIE